MDHADANDILGFATAFAMPTLSEWRPHTQSVGMSDRALQQIGGSRGGTDFLAAMSACLRQFPDRGPNGALLVAVLAAMRNRRLRVWANDIEDAHYDGAIASLESLDSKTREVVPNSGCLARRVGLFDTLSSIDDLRITLDNWQEQGVKSVLGFLDPMGYLCHSTDGPYTSQTDHRRWLWRFRPWRTSLLVQFTGNNDSASLEQELHCLRADLEAIGLAHWLEVRRQHYVVSVGSQALDLVESVRQRVVRSWNEWCDKVDEIKTRDLVIERSAAAGARGTQPTAAGAIMGRWIGQHRVPPSSPLAGPTSEIIRLCPEQCQHAMAATHVSCASHGGLPVEATIDLEPRRMNPGDHGDAAMGPGISDSQNRS